MPGCSSESRIVIVHAKMHANELLSLKQNEKIWKRAGHFSFEFRGEMFIWGGYVEHLQRVSKNTLIYN